MLIICIGKEIRLDKTPVWCYIISSYHMLSL